MQRPTLYPALLATVALLAPQGVPAQPTWLSEITRWVAPAPDKGVIERLDEERVANNLPPHFAVPIEVGATPLTLGDWSMDDPETARWRLRVASPGAQSLSLAFSRFRMPEGGSLAVVPLRSRRYTALFTSLDNEPHGQLWTPPMPGSELLLEVELPLEAVGELELELDLVHHGYAGFFSPTAKVGDCNVDVACPEGDEWRAAARSVALLAVEGVRFCSGVLLNNVEGDGRPFLLTAAHCGLHRGNAASLVVYWGHEASGCRGRERVAETGDLSRFQTGSVFRARSWRSDFVLVELDDPPDPASEVYFAGWDRRDRAPLRTVAIHHPNTDARRMSVDDDPPTVTSHLKAAVPGDGTHLRIGDWELGTTEGGSSGSPLFDGEARVVGHLHGGLAACGKQEPDWFGRFTAAWVGDGRPGTRLSDWLDPLGRGVLTLDGSEHAALAAEVGASELERELRELP